MLIFLVLSQLLAIGNALYSSSGPVVDLTEQNFAKLVKNSDDIWLVEFYAPWCGHCRQLVPEYEKAARGLAGIAKVGAINTDDHKSLAGEFGVQGFPTIMIFGANKRSPVKFESSRKASTMVDAVLAEIKKKVYSQLGEDGKQQSSGGGGGSGGKSDVIELTDANFDSLVMNSDEPWLIEFFAPWCGHCKNLEPHWAKAATELRGKVKLGAVDATVHTIKAQRFEVQGYPTIKFFPAGKKDIDSVTDYSGGRTSSDIVSWSLDKYADSIPAPEVVQLTSDSVLKSECENKPLCIVSVLPHILDCDAKCRNKYLGILRDNGAQFKQKIWGWVWTEAGAQMDIENSLEMGGFGYPAMAVLNIKKMKFSLLRGSFSYDGIKEFLRDISYGRGSTAPVKGGVVPKIQTTEPWDGKDGQIPEEEEIDLSDIDLDEKDEL